MSADATANEPDAQTAAAGWRDDTIALLAIVVMTGAGAGLFFRTEVYLTLGLVAGLTAGLGGSRWWRAALAGFLGVYGGFALASLVAEPRWLAGLFWVPLALPAASVAAVVGAAVCFAVDRSARLKPLLTAIAVLALIATMWFSGLALASSPSNQGIVPLDRLASTPKLERTSSDEDIYLTYLAGLRAGQPYYKVVASAIAEMNAVRPESPVAITSPLSYRLPTLYVVLAKMPSAGMLVNLMLVACSLGVVAAFLLARRFVAAVPALVATSLVASMFAGYTGPMLLDTESWAGILGLCAVLFVVLADGDSERPVAWHAAAAACAFLAACVRELSVAFLLLGLAAALVQRAGGRRRAWLPWAVAIAATAAVYVAHWRAVAAAVRGLTSPHVVAFPWFHPDGSGLAAAVGLFANHMWVATWFGWILLAVGMAGSLIAPKALPSRVMLGGVAFAGPLLLLVLHPPGWATYGVPGYWGDLVVPTAHACVPLALARVSGVGRADRA